MDNNTSVEENTIQYTCYLVIFHLFRNILPMYRIKH